MAHAEVYLDSNATTHPLQCVIDAMLPYLRENFANPSSRYPAATAARKAIEEARAVVANFIGAGSPRQIVFTSGGTESIALALASGGAAGRAIVVSATEHDAVLAAASRWSRAHPAEIVRVDANGHVDLAGLERLVSLRPSLVSIAHANNETGVICDVGAVAQICRRHGALLHCDAVQSAAKLEIDVEAMGCDFLTISAHKVHAVKGTGALYIRDFAAAIPLSPGHHESGIRGGTENVAGIVAFATALGALSEWDRDVERVSALRDRLESLLLETVPGAKLNGSFVARLCNTANVYFPRRDAADLVEQLGSRGICVSAGAACTTGGEPSHVLMAMNLGRERANSSLRFSLSRFTTADEVSLAASVVAEVYRRALPTY